jgi:hypothetical protein
MAKSQLDLQQRPVEALTIFSVNLQLDRASHVSVRKSANFPY